jgi:cytochrome c oxidase cbb3-type subunit 1
MMFIPVLTVAINHHMTMRGNFAALAWSPTLRFTVFGAMMYTLVSFQGSTMAIPSLNALTHFTDYTIGHAHLGVYAFFTMMMFGAMYYIVPRLIQWEWPSASLIRWHFWLAAIGILVMVGALTLGGLLQGFALNDPEVNFMMTLQLVWPWRLVRSISGTAMMVAHILFAINFALILLKVGGAKKSATLFAKPSAAAREESEPVPA